LRECGCEDRGRHKRTCLKHTERKGQENTLPEKAYSKEVSMRDLYTAGYGEPPHLSWYPNKDKQRTVEHKIEGFVRRHKAFYLTTISLEDLSEEEETWYIDGGNWASKTDSNGYNKLIGHIKNCLEFLGGRRPKWEKRRTSL
tara:strand:- start:434 stop:859 length:426 start_codon:yes stop_codon:yes gene_type:complete